MFSSYCIDNDSNYDHNYDVYEFAIEDSNDDLYNFAVEDSNDDLDN